MRLGIDRLLADPALKKSLQGKRLALVAHPASVTSSIKHSLDALCDASFNIVSAFGPQHGMRGEKQENMIESDDYVDPFRKIPVFSLYGEVRRPTKAMMDTFDIALFDLQDIGCRIYTYLSTLLYMMEECARHKKPLWVLDRPNPVGRPIEGNLLDMAWATFVGVCAVPMRHGMTLGELALWMKQHHRLELDLKVIAMEGYDPHRAPGYGWPLNELTWINPSPNIPTLASTRAFCGTVLVEGTNLSEARGTTRPLEMVGAPGMDAEKVIREMERFEPRWLEGGVLRPCYFEPVFHKHKLTLCAGIQIHCDDASYRHEKFRPFRLQLSMFKAIRRVHPEMLKWRDPPYEYENIRLPVDILNGSDQPRLWVDDPRSAAADLERMLTPDETSFVESRRPHLLYP